MAVCILSQCSGSELDSFSTHPDESIPSFQKVLEKRHPFLYIILEAVLLVPYIYPLRQCCDHCDTVDIMCERHLRASTNVKRAAIMFHHHNNIGAGNMLPYEYPSVYFCVNPLLYMMVIITWGHLTIVTTIEKSH